MMKSSFTNRIWNFSTRNIDHLSDIVSTFLIRFKCIFQDVKLGSGVKFKGIAKFNVGNGGSITIGKGCRFLSRETSNNMGINHRCIISSTPPTRMMSANYKLEIIVASAASLYGVLNL